MIEFSLLGPTELRATDGAEIRSVLVQPKRLALLAYLCCELPLGFHRRESLLALFWPEADEASARNGLRKAIYYLRRACGEDAIVGRGSDEIGVDASRISCDVPAFVEAARDGALGRALELYRGDLLTGFALADCGAFEEWLSRTRSRLRDQASRAAIALAEQEASRDNVRGAIEILERARELHPDNEDALRRLLQLQHQAGDRAGVEAAYGKFERYLAVEYDAEPASETLALMRRLRTPFEAPLPQLAGSSRQEPTPAAIETPRALGTPLAARHTPRYRQVMAAAVLGAGVLATLLVARVPRGEGSSGDAAPASVVAVLPFAFHGAPDLSYTGAGLTSLVAAGIDNLPEMHTVNPRMLMAADSAVATRDPARGAEDARRAGAGSFVLGDVTTSSGRMRVTASMFDIDRRGHARGVGPAIVVDGPVDSLFALADRLTADLAATRSARTRAPVSTAALQGTSSIVALRAYLDGERAFRAGKYDAAILDYQQAVAADSTFALAYLHLSQAANWVGDGRLQRQNDAQAQRLRDHLSSRDRRRADAWHAGIMRDIPRSETLYRGLVRDDSTDAEAWYYLADLIYHWGASGLGMPAAESRAAWTRALALVPNDASSLLHLARIAAAEGDRTGFDSLSARLAAVSPGRDVVTEVDAVRAFAFGDSASRRAAAAAIAGPAVRVNIALDLVGHIASASSDLAGVTELWLAIERDLPPSPLHGQILLHAASASLARGRMREADALVQRAVVFAPSMGLRYRALTTLLPFGVPSSAVVTSVGAAVARGDTIAAQADAAVWREYVPGILALQRGDANEAARRVAALDRIAPSSDSAVDAWPRRLDRMLRAEVAMRAGRTDDALATLGTVPFIHVFFGDPSSGLISARERWLRAEALARLGRTREALRVFASFPDLSGVDVAYAPIAHLRRAELHETLGERVEAAMHYRRALAYWTSADAEVQPVARRAAAGLQRVGGRSRRD